MLLLKILSAAGLGLLLINVVIYSIGFSKKEKAYRIFFLYLLLLFIIQGLGEIYASNNQNNHFLATYILIIPFIFLSLFFYNLFLGVNTRKRKFIKYCSSIIAVGLIVQYSREPGLYFDFNSYGLLVSTCVLVIYSVLYLFELISKQLPFHYVTIGIFVYYISSSLIFVSVSSIVSFNVEISMFIWKINALLFIVYQLLILWEWKQTFYLKPTKQD